MKPWKNLIDSLGREQWMMIAIAAAGLLLRIIYLVEFSSLPHFDFAIGADVGEYHARAMELLDGRIFPEQPEIHAPLYSWFLAGMYYIGGGSIAFVRIMQLLLNFAAYAGMTVLLKKQGAPFKVQACFFAGAMLVPVLFFHQAELISESLFAPLICLFMWLMEAGKKHWRNIAGAGVVLGALILTHGLMLFFVVFEVGFLLLKKQWRQLLLLIAGIAVAVLPLVALKSYHYGKLTGVQGNSGYNLWIGHNPDATGGCYLRPGKMWREPLKQVKKEAAERGISENDVCREKILAFYAGHSEELVVMPLKKAALLVSWQEPVAGADVEALIRMTAVQSFGGGMFAVVLILAICGAYFAVQGREKIYMHFYLLTIAGTAAALLTVVSGRYRQGIVPGLLLLSALGAVKLERRALYLSLIIFTAGTLMISRNVTGNAEAASILGEAEYRSGNFAQAKEYLLLAEQELDDPARFDNMLGAIAHKEGNSAEAERRYRNAILNDPDDADAWLNLGALIFRQPGRRAEAVALLNNGVVRDRMGSSGYNLLGIAAAEKGDFAAAEKYFVQAVKNAPGNMDYENNLVICRKLAQKKGVRK